MANPWVLVHVHVLLGGPLRFSRPINAAEFKPKYATSKFSRCFLERVDYSLPSAPRSACAVTAATFNDSALKVRHPTTATILEAVAQRINTKWWSTQLGAAGEIDHAKVMARPAGPTERPRLSAVLYSPENAPRRWRGGMSVDAITKARLTYLTFGTDNERDQERGWEGWRRLTGRCRFSVAKRL